MSTEQLAATRAPSKFLQFWEIPKDTNTLAIYALCVTTAVLSVPLVVGGTIHTIRYYPDLTTPLFIVGSLVACAFAWVRYPAEASYLRITLAGCSVLIGLNTLWLGFDFPIVNQEAYDGTAPIIAVAPYVTVGAAALAVFRPSFALIVAAIFIIEKQLVTAMAGGMPAFNHYIVLIDTMVFIAIALVGLELACLAGRRFPKVSMNSRLSAPQNLSFYYLLVMCIAIGVHFGNYFLSGYGKIALDGGPLSWVFENKTQYLMLAGYNLGAAPLSFSSSVFGLAYTILDNTYVISNIAVVFAQFFCILAFLRKELMIAWIIFFDVMHISIFILTGALFVHWIVLNALLLISVTRMPKNLAPRAAIVAGVIATLFGHFFFHTIMLAWYDNRQVRDAGFVAVFEDGSEAMVPPSYFRESSYSFYNRWFRFNADAHDQSGATDDTLVSLKWQAQTVPWGQVNEIEAMRRGEVCGVPTDTANVKVDFNIQAVEDFIRARHRWVMHRVGKGEALNYHLFPHDHFSMPWRFRDFETADVKDIAAYYYRVETVCLSWENGEFKRQVLTRTATKPFWVREDGDEALRYRSTRERSN